jgi:hypothetical protein
MSESDTHVLVIVTDRKFDAETLARVRELCNVTVIIDEPQTPKAEEVARWLSDVQAKQIWPRPGKETGSPWFRQFEKRRRDRR